MQGAFKEQEIAWGGATKKVKIAGYERRPLPSTEQTWKLDQIKCLPTIGRIAREEKIKLYTYNELTHEAWKRPGSFPSNILGNIFSGVTFNHVDAAIERSFFFQMDISEYVTNKQVIEFCKWLLSPNIESLAGRLSEQDRYPAYLLKNLQEVQRFRDLCSGLAERQYPDAFHLWTAEVRGAEYFLTTDQKFIRVMTETKHLSLPCKPLSPSDLLNVLKISERDPFEYPEGQFFTIFGEPS